MNTTLLPIDDAVAQAYDAFKHHQAPGVPLDVCGCCVSQDIERDLRTLPLKQIPAAHLYAYNCSAKRPEQPVGEVAYFLPRMFELMASEEGLIHHSTELNLDRLGRCPKESWNQGEWAAITDFSRSFFHRVITDRDPGEQPLSVLLMFHIAGVDIAPLLDQWLTTSTPVATANFVIDTYSNFWEGGDYANPFAADHPEFRQLIREWIFHPETRARFLDKLRATDFLAMSRDASWGSSMPFPLMVEAALENLAS
ncbi:hypothetical protein SAMN05216359_101710 [Roseateles sp. YR242]|uniref:hypothetical protein n=1 Tax=Roseateles sp. YR242 TaxID=1855305 RepID=UPI0008CD5F41|nr:hypothetical protein [Roseateles sp. YR242]SEK40341.1 hypothetical protein SAMN05216359_101710 [Roseateles sp. YR242]